ncbi:hypothetical protein HY498_05045 [Candidatus Woesearchaeota archaeon]|nr:hypothetical protein [Candidatus Woesearchaeota archaeon]
MKLHLNLTNYQKNSFCYPKPKFGAALKSIISEDIWTAEQYCIKSHLKAK